MKLIGKITPTANNLPKELLEYHTYWVYQLPLIGELTCAILDYGVCKVTIEVASKCLVVSGLTDQWYDLAGWLLEDESLSLRKLGTTLVMSNNDLFGSLSRTLKPDGTIVLRR